MDEDSVLDEDLCYTLTAVGIDVSNEADPLVFEQRWHSERVSIGRSNFHGIKSIPNEPTKVSISRKAIELLCVEQKESITIPARHIAVVRKALNPIHLDDTVLEMDIPMPLSDGQVIWLCSNRLGLRFRLRRLFPPVFKEDHPTCPLLDGSSIKPSLTFHPRAAVMKEVFEHEEGEQAKVLRTSHGRDGGDANVESEHQQKKRKLVDNGGRDTEPPQATARKRSPTRAATPPRDTHGEGAGGLPCGASQRRRVSPSPPMCAEKATSQEDAKRSEEEPKKVEKPAGPLEVNGMEVSLSEVEDLMNRVLSQGLQWEVGSNSSGAVFKRPPNEIQEIWLHIRQMMSSSESDQLLPPQLEILYWDCVQLQNLPLNGADDKIIFPKPRSSHLEQQPKPTVSTSTAAAPTHSKETEKGFTSRRQSPTRSLTSPTSLPSPSNREQGKKGRKDKNSDADTPGVVESTANPFGVRERGREGSDPKEKHPRKSPPLLSPPRKAVLQRVAAARSLGKWKETPFWDGSTLKSKSKRWLEDIWKDAKHGRYASFDEVVRDLKEVRKHAIDAGRLANDKDLIVEMDQLYQRAIKTKSQHHQRQPPFRFGFVPQAATRDDLAKFLVSYGAHWVQYPTPENVDVVCLSAKLLLNPSSSEYFRTMLDRNIRFVLGSKYGAACVEAKRLLPIDKYEKLKSGGVLILTLAGLMECDKRFPDRLRELRWNHGFHIVLPAWELRSLRLLDSETSKFVDASMKALANDKVVSVLEKNVLAEDVLIAETEAKRLSSLRDNVEFCLGYWFLKNKESRSSGARHCVLLSRRDSSDWQAATREAVEPRNCEGLVELVRKLRANGS